MVHSVVTRCVENPLQGAQMSDGLCVQPKLEQQTKLLVRYKVGWWNEEGEGQVEQLESSNKYVIA